MMHRSWKNRRKLEAAKIPARRRDRAQGLVGRGGMLGGDVAQRDDAHQAVCLLVDDRDAADLLVAHLGQHFVHRLGGVAGAHLGAHDIAHAGGFGRFALGGRTDRDVAVGQHADQLRAVAYRHGADVEFFHQLGGAAHGVFWRDAGDIAGHYVLNSLHLDLRTGFIRRSNDARFSIKSTHG
jgi:hypothetical protein